MGQGQHSSRLTLARVKKLAEEIRSCGELARKYGANALDNGFTYAGMCGGLQSVLTHLAAETCGMEAHALIEAAFNDAFARSAAAQPVEVAL